MNTVFTVTNSNPSNGGKTHVWTLDASVEATVFGIKKTVKRTYYIGGMTQAATVGSKLEENINRFDIKERPCYQVKTGKIRTDGSDEYANVEWKDENSEPENYDRKLMLKWLHVRV